MRPCMQSKKLKRKLERNSDSFELPPEKRRSHEGLLEDSLKSLEVDANILRIDDFNKLPAEIESSQVGLLEDIMRELEANNPFSSLSNQYEQGQPQSQFSMMTTPDLAMHMPEFIPLVKSEKWVESDSSDRNMAKSGEALIADTNYSRSGTTKTSM